jgi:tRNA threonylcarbamoyladenosine biosynthesis protein TsaB
LRIGLQSANGTINEVQSGDRYRHAEFIMTLIEQLLTDNNVNRIDLKAIVVSTGPGSFTGLRVGLATAKGLALALNIPLVGISNYEASARSIYSEFGDVVLMIPSRRDEFYCGLIKSEYSDKKNIEVYKSEEIRNKFKKTRLFCIDLNNAKFDDSLLLDINEFTPTIRNLITAGQEKLRQTGGSNIELLEPLYIQSFPGVKKK